MKKRSGIKLLDERIGTGEEIQRHKWYRMSFRMWLPKGEPIKWSKPFGLLDEMVISEDGQTLTADYRIDRVFLFSGLLIEGVVPPNAVLKVEVEIIAEREMK
jgi:hypothetical protein